jgi:hypothetical protein
MLGELSPWNAGDRNPLALVSPQQLSVQVTEALGFFPHLQSSDDNTGLLIPWRYFEDF